MKIYPKLVITFLAALLPLNLLGLYMNYSSMVTVKAEISGSLQSKAHFYMSLIESDLLRTLKSQQEFVSDDDLLKLSVQGSLMDQNAKREAYLRLERRLDLLLNSSAFMEAAALDIPLLHRSITNNEIRDEMPEEYTALRFASSRYQKPFVTWKDRVFLNLVYPERSFDGLDKAPLFVLTLELSKARLQDVLEQLTKEYRGGALFEGTGMSWEVASFPGGPFPKEVSDALRETVRTDAGPSVRTVRSAGSNYIITVEHSPLLGVSLATVIPERLLLGSLQKFQMWMWGIIIVTVAVALLFSYRLYRVIHRPLQKLVFAFRKVEQGNLDIEVSHPSGDEFGYLYSQFNMMVQQVRKLIHEVFEQKYRLRLSELKQLQSQINPHFLYNTYFSMYYMAKHHEYENLMTFVKYLGEYFQFITRNADEEVQLSLEIKHAMNYIRIQGIRFHNRVETIVGELPQVTERVRVPRLILQPIIENAYKHGLEDREEGGVLWFRFVVSGPCITIEVENNGALITDEELLNVRRKLQTDEPGKETTGMINVHRRLRIRYGETGGLIVERGEHGGWKVGITIPFDERT